MKCFSSIQNLFLHPQFYNNVIVKANEIKYAVFFLLIVSNNLLNDYVWELVPVLTLN